MRKIVVLIMSCLIVVSLSLPLWAAPLETYEVTRLDMRGDLIRDIDIHPTNPAIVYLIGQNGGVHKSTDSGQTWSHLLGMDGRGLSIDRRNPDTVYAAGLSAVYKTTDGGKTWNLIHKAKLRSIGVHPASGVIFGGGNSGKIYRSEDGGVTWTEPQSATNGEINKWAFHPTDPNIVYHSAAKNRGIYMSTDGGKSFQLVLKEYGRAVAISPSNPNILYSSLHKSIDGGKTWRHTGGSQAWAIAIHPKNPDIVYKASQGDAVFMTTNGGRHWTQMKGLTRGGLTALTANWSIAIDGEKDILYVGAAVLYKADSARSSSTVLYESSKGINTPDVVSIAGAKDVLWLGSDGQGVSRSTDYGRSWQRRLLGLRGKLNLGSLNIHPLDSDIIYSTGEGGLVKTNDSGRIWLHMPKPPGRVRGVIVDPLDKNGVYTVVDQKLYYSRDGGFNWQEWEKAKDKAVRRFLIHPSDPRTLLIQTDKTWQFSKDGGQSWKDVRVPGIGEIIVSRNAATPETYYFVQNGKVLWRSAGGGDWEKLLDIEANHGLLESPNGTIWVADKLQVHRSTDGGKTWESRRLPANLRRILVDPNNPEALYVAGKGGLFHLHPAGMKLPDAPPSPPTPPAPEPATIKINAAGVLDRANTTYQLTVDIVARSSVFYVTADNITIDGQGHKVEFALSAVEANGVSNLTVKNMKAHQSTIRQGASYGDAHAIDLMFCPNATVSGLTIETDKRSSDAISISGDNAVVSDNIISKIGAFATAIGVEGKAARVTNNQLNASDSGRGIAVSDAAEAQVENNTITYGGPTPIAGILATLAPRAAIRGNTIRGSGRAIAALHIQFSEGVTVADNTIASDSPLLHLEESSKANVHGNKLEATINSALRTANPVMRLENTNGSTISSNEITLTDGKRPALAFENSSNSTVTENRLVGADLKAPGTILQDDDSKENVIR